MIPTLRPTLRMLSEPLVKEIISEAREVLKTLGIFVENEEARDLLASHGQQVDREKQLVYFTDRAIDQALETFPRSFKLYDRAGEKSWTVGGDQVHFDPGSAAINLLDEETGVVRPPVTADFVRFLRVVDRLGNLDFQSTALVCADVPKEMADRWRLYLCLTHGRKPVVTGTFLKESFGVMKEMLIAVRGSAAALAEKPLAIFDACPSPPLKWSVLTCQSVLDAARCGIPSEFISMPIFGATGPVTLTGSLVQHTAETLSGVVIAQLAKAGTPVVWGGSPTGFDMRRGTPPVAAIEAIIFDASYAQIGKSLGFPTHAYMGLSDSKVLDAQAGLESGIGAVTAALTGINVVSGAGMLDFESCQSLEKLVVDNEICGMALRMVSGVAQRDTPMALPLLREIREKGHLLAAAHTSKWFREEGFITGPTICRSTRQDWEKEGKRTVRERAREQVQEMLAKPDGAKLPAPVQEKLDALVRRDAATYGVEKLPAGA